MREFVVMRVMITFSSLRDRLSDWSACRQSDPLGKGKVDVIVTGDKDLLEIRRSDPFGTGNIKGF